MYRNIITIIAVVVTLITIWLIFMAGKIEGKVEFIGYSTKHVCTREIHPAPKEWCNDVLLKEIFSK